MSTIDTTTARKHFLSVDTIMANELIARVSDTYKPLRIPTPAEPNDYFQNLVRIIIGQQISTKAADSIYLRLENTMSVSPKHISDTKYTILKEVGLSNNKIKSITELANSWHVLNTSQWPTQTNESIEEELVAHYGVGSWTVQMFLLFVLARSDIFSVNDLGLRKRIHQLYDVPVNDLVEINSVSSRWSPHRSLAALVLWHGLDNTS